MAAARVIRALHSQIAKSSHNPAYRIADELSLNWGALSKEERTEEAMKALVNSTTKSAAERGNDDLWPIPILGCTKVHAQASDVRLPSPFDNNQRPSPDPMFFATTYLGWHRVTVSIA